MTSYVTIPNTDVDAESPIDVDLMTALRDNPTAITEGATGAPKIVNGALNSHPWNRSDLDTSNGSVSRIGTGGTNLTLPGGLYGFYPQTSKVGSNATGFGHVFSALSAYGYTTTIYLYSANPSDDIYAQQTYINACAPYDLGDGEIPLFIFAGIDNTTKKVVFAYEAPEAPWHYNGPTDIGADFYKDNKGYKYMKNMDHVPFTLEEAKADPVKLKEYMTEFSLAEDVEVEITQEIKNKDMALLPQPFSDYEENVTICLLDPVCDDMFKLSELRKHAEFSVLDMLHGGKIQIDNTPLSRNGPPNVPIFRFSW